MIVLPFGNPAMRHPPIICTTTIYILCICLCYIYLLVIGNGIFLAHFHPYLCLHRKVHHDNTCHFRTLGDGFDAIVAGAYDLLSWPLRSQGQFFGAVRMVRLPVRIRG